MFNGSTLKYYFGGSRFDMLPQYHKFSQSLSLNNPLQVLLIGNQRDQVPLFIYINHAAGVYSFVRGSKVIGDMKYLTRSVKQAVEAVEI